MPSLREIWGILRRRALIIAFSLLFFAILPCVLLLFVKPVFRASAQLKILYSDSQGQYLTGVPPDVGRLEYAEKTKIDDTFFEIVKNPESLRQVIADLHLSASGGATLYPEDLLMDSVVSMLFQSEGVAVELAGSGAEIVEVVGYSQTPERAAALANALTERFVEIYAEMFRSRARATVRVVDARLPAVEEQLRRAQRAKEAFLRENGAVDLAAEQDHNLTAFYTYRDQLNQNAKQIVQTREEIAQIKATMGDIAQVQLTERAVERNSLINDYRNQIASLESAMAGSLTELTAAHPANVATQKRVESLRAALSQEIEKVLARETESRNPYYDDLIKRLNNDVISDQVNTAVGEKLEALLKETQQSMDRILSLQSPVAELDRQVTMLSSSFMELQRARNAASQVMELSPTNVGMLNRADPALVNPRKPYFPNWVKVLALCPLLAAGVAFGLILAAEAMDRTFKTEVEARAALAEALLAGIPRQPRRFTRGRAMGDVYREALLAPKVDCRERFEAWMARDGVGDGVGNVLSGLRLGSGGGLPRAVLITGAAGGCGATTVAFCAAGALAQAGRKILLVGPAAGLPSDEAGGSAGEEALRTDLEGLSILNPAATHAFLGACTPEMLAALPYDHVVFDPGPLSLKADSLLAGRVCGAAAVCFVLGETPVGDVLASVERLRGLVPGQTWGVLNKC